jgi:hypothetical protein
MIACGESTGICGVMEELGFCVAFDEEEKEDDE